jgi:hypothetical protein
MARRKRTNNDITKHTHKTKDRVTPNPLNIGVKSGAPEGWGVVGGFFSSLFPYICIVIGDQVIKKKGGRTQLTG